MTLPNPPGKVIIYLNYRVVLWSNISDLSINQLLRSGRAGCEGAGARGEDPEDQGDAGGGPEEETRRTQTACE